MTVGALPVLQDDGETPVLQLPFPADFPVRQFPDAELPVGLQAPPVADPPLLQAVVALWPLVQFAARATSTACKSSSPGFS